MLTLLGKDFVPEPVTWTDFGIASLALGFTLGIGFLATWTAIKQTSRIERKYGKSKLNTPYVWLIWLEIAVCLVMSILCWVHLYGVLPPSFLFFFWILTCWALQVQFLLQIIINRICLLLTDRQKAFRLKFGVAAIITFINISVYCIWIPARLQTSHTIIFVNEIWDRCEKVIYLIIDGLLNWYFIRIVQRRLVEFGLTKYDRLVRFNKWIIGFSLSMDVLIIAMMSLGNTFVYIQFHPLAYIVKLNIEMSMADLIVKVSNTPSSTMRIPSTLEKSPSHITVLTHLPVVPLTTPPTIPSERSIAFFHRPLNNMMLRRRASVVPVAIDTSIGRDEMGEICEGNGRVGFSASSMDFYSTPRESLEKGVRSGGGEEGIKVSMKREVRIEVERRSVELEKRRTSGSGSETSGEEVLRGQPMGLEDERLCYSRGTGEEERKMGGVRGWMGVHTTVWAP